MRMSWYGGWFLTHLQFLLGAGKVLVSQQKRYCWWWFENLLATTVLQNSLVWLHFSLRCLVISRFGLIFSQNSIHSLGTISASLLIVTAKVVSSLLNWHQTSVFEAWHPSLYSDSCPELWSEWNGQHNSKYEGLRITATVAIYTSKALLTWRSQRILRHSYTFTASPRSRVYNLLRSLQALGAQTRRKRLLELPSPYI